MIWTRIVSNLVKSKSNFGEYYNKKNFDNLYEPLSETYREENGHLIPNVTLPEQPDYQIGKYGQFYLEYIKNHCRGRYTTLPTECYLNARLNEIDLKAILKKQRLELCPRSEMERGLSAISLDNLYAFVKKLNILLTGNVVQ